MGVAFWKKSSQYDGEAVKAIPQPLRARYSAVPWQDVAGMRDKLIHGYFGINLRRVWATARDDVPVLRETVAQMLADLDAEDDSG